MRRLLARFARTPSGSDEAAGVRGLPPDGDRSPLHLLSTLPGRLFLLSSAILLVLSLSQQFLTLPEFLDLLRRVAALASLASLAWLAVIAVTRSRRAFLWRVRSKLLLSYIFIGVVPLVLVLAFVLTGSMLLYITVAPYVFSDGLRDVASDVQQIAEAAALEIGRTPTEAQTVIDAKYGSQVSRYPALSLAVVSVSGGPALTAGSWQHAPAVVTVPPWVVKRHDFLGRVVAALPAAPNDIQVVIRAAAPTPDMRRFVIADVPVDASIAARLTDRTGTSMGRVTARDCGTFPTTEVPASRSLWSLFQQTVAMLDCTRWSDGATGTLSINVVAPISQLANRLNSIQAASIQEAVGPSWWTVFIQLLFLLGVLFLIIQGSALVMGGVLAKSITSAVHELFVGTERVQQGDFAHRIRIESRDQLGDLADSFNRMSGSIEYLLHVQREKQRLDDELRIAREIQKSLLPVQPPKMAGIDIADLCEPAREVGGDYYDFFELGPRQLGVLIADVSGKGTSAALYMAELKGLMLALSRTERSPRRLLIELNRLLAEHLDNRSFITMIYAVIDLEQRTVTSARAGHTPLIVVSNGVSEVIVPDGMVLGLRLPGAGERFEQVLDEHTASIHPGDVMVFYTDGVTEATDGAGEMFGDEALARVIVASSALDASAIRERVVRDVKTFVGAAEPHDDMTMVIIKFDTRDAEVA